MLESLSPEVRECLKHAEDCAERAKRERDPALRRDFFDMELRWLKLARSYQFVEQIVDFTSHNTQQRRELTERLEQLKRKLDGEDPDLL